MLASGQLCFALAVKLSLPTGLESSRPMTMELHTSLAIPSAYTNLLLDYVSLLQQAAQFAEMRGIH